MDFRFSSKRDLYYEKVTKLHFQDGLGVTQISRAFPVSRAILYKWIAIFYGIKVLDILHTDKTNGIVDLIALLRHKQNPDNTVT